MKQSFYLFSNGTLSRKDSTLRFESSEGTVRDLPIERIADIFCFGEINYNSRMLALLSQYGILLHVFGYYGNYIGSFCPKENLLSGKVHIKQAEHYLDGQKRICLAREFILAGTDNIYRNLRYYDERGRDFQEPMAAIRSMRKQIESATAVDELMGCEGTMRKLYYGCWPMIFSTDTGFVGRSYDPPDNMVNSLISFINMMVYSKVVTAIYNTQLDPTISYLHEPGSRRYSLSLDIAEVFKPLLSDRLIFSLINRKQINSDSFEHNANCVQLKESVRKLIVSEFDNRLKQTIMHKNLKRQVSYERLIRLEAYKVIKHVLDEKPYEGFRIWW